jgi:hypothetical protein
MGIVCGRLTTGLQTLGVSSLDGREGICRDMYRRFGVGRYVSGV